MIDSRTKVHFDSLDGLRSIAFFMVFLSHGFAEVWNALGNLSNQNSFIRIFSNLHVNLGHEGVSVFFVLSGFLITYLILSEIELNKTLNVKFFYIRRCLRIWPLFYAVVFFGLIVYPLLYKLMGMPVRLGGYPWMNLVFLNNFDLLFKALGNDIGYNPILQITWSVAIEEQFYVFWPLLFAFTPRRLFLPAVIFILICSLFFRWRNEASSYTIYFHSFSAMGDLATGGLCAYAMLYFSKAKTFFWSAPNKTRVVFYLFVFLAFLFGESVFAYGYEHFFGRLIKTICYAYVILDQSFNQNSFLKLVHNSMLTYWGKYTYGLYLLHPIAIFLVKNVLDKTGVLYKEDIWGGLIIGSCALPLSLLMSYFSYHYYESYFLRLKERFAFITK